MNLSIFSNEIVFLNRKILELKPGLTSLASLKYSREEKILDRYENHQMCNDLIIFRHVSHEAK